jgi:hypothetical protein
MIFMARSFDTAGRAIFGRSGERRNRDFGKQAQPPISLALAKNPCDDAFGQAPTNRLAATAAGRPPLIRSAVCETGSRFC